MRYLLYALLVLFLVATARGIRELFSLAGIPTLANDLPLLLDSAMLIAGTVGLLFCRPGKTSEAETAEDATVTFAAPAYIAGVTTAITFVLTWWLGMSQQGPLWVSWTMCGFVMWHWASNDLPLWMCVRLGLLWALLIGAAFAGGAWAALGGALLVGVFLLGRYATPEDHG